MSNVIPFDFDGHAIRVVADDTGEPWFAANEVCDVLGFANSRDAVGRHVDADDVGKRDTIDSLGRSQSVNHVNESGLYALIFGSTKAEAKRFKKWVTSEVLPSIRKTGGYSVNLADPAQLRQVLLGYTEKVIALETQVSVMEPKVEALNRIALADGSMCLTDAAKHLQVQPKWLFRWLQEHQWVYRRAGGSGFIGYQSRIQVGYLEHKVSTVERSDGSTKAAEQVRITAKGLAKLAEVLSMKEAV